MAFHGASDQEIRGRVCKVFGGEICVCGSSGTAALHIAQGVIGIGQGDEVIVP